MSNFGVEGRSVKFGFIIPQGALRDLKESSPDKQFQSIKDIVKEGEALGFDSGWLVDHLETIPLSHESCFEGWTLLVSLFSEAKRLRLGHLVTCNLFRTPSYLAKIASTVDVISNGRLEFGIGAGWYEEECKGFGIPFPSPRERIERLGEALEITRRMWDNNEKATNFHGKYYQLHGAINYPKPLQKPHPPIWIGGNGRRLLKLVAKYADRWNPNCSISVFPEKLQLLGKACEKTGRDARSIEITYALNTLIGDESYTRKLLEKIEKEHLLFDFEAGVVGTPETCVKTLENLRSMGVSYFIFILPNASEVEPLRMIAKEVIPKISSGH
jgi:F420-dependent oxidoreductase-like protein